MKKSTTRVKCILIIMLLLCTSFLPLYPVQAYTGQGTMQAVNVDRKEVAYKNTPYGKHGKLTVKGTKLVDKDQKAFQLKGISSHGINWDVGEPFVNEKALKDVRDVFHANCFRVAMYTTDYNGYCVTDPQSRADLLKTIDKAVKAAKKLGLYVIIDWHVLNDQNPLVYEKEAKAFFKKVSTKYASYGNVMYEICNEPNGQTSWNDIKKYAKAVIPIIRRSAPNAVIIVGTPNWSQDVDVAATSPIKGQKNLMYAFHFYAATHQDHYMQKVKDARKKKLPVICTEFSASEASGNGYLNFQSAQKWLKYLKQNKIGCCCWSLSNKPESCSLLANSCWKRNGFKTSDLSEMGKWIKKQYYSM